MELKYFHENQPKINSRFVAFYADASGAELFLRDPEGDYYDAEGRHIEIEDWFGEANFYSYADLPDEFRLYFEEK
jgi:hypothetical protein